MKAFILKKTKNLGGSMKKILFGLLITAFVVGAIGCGGGENTVKESNIPEWFLNPPQDPDYLFGVNSSTSTQMQLALDKAKAGARADVAQQMETKVSVLVKSFQEEVGAGEDAELNSFYNQTMKNIANQTLQGSRVREQKIVPKSGNMYQAYVLMEVPLVPFNKEVVQKVKNMQLYDRFRASQAFDDLEKDIEKYEQEQQGQ